MKKLRNLFAALAVLAAGLQANAQTEQGNLLFNLGSDLYRTDNPEFFKRFAFGADLSYFVADKLSLGAGVEHVSYANSGNATDFTVLFRWFPFGTFSTEMKTIGFEEFSLGLGNDFMMNDNFGINLNGDYYFKASDFGFRLGISWFIG